MSKLVDIKGYLNMSDEYDFNDKYIWEGKLLLEDDGWFEGIVNDSISPYTGDMMIYGIYHPSKIIELYKVALANVSDIYVYRGQRNSKGYQGYYSVFGYRELYYCGVSNLITQHVDYLKEKGYPEVADRDTEAEKQELAKKIAYFKQSNNLAEIYENIKGMRFNLSLQVLCKYTGNNISNKQVEEFLVPFSYKIEDATNNYSKKLVKGMKSNDFDLGNDELLFL